MRRTNTRNVLISVPSSWDHGTIPYLPYVWGVLKSYFEQHSNAAERWNWLEPIWLPGDSSSLLKGRDLSTIDVLGLSCYIWNWEQQTGIAQRVKEANPDCLIVAGGPHPDYRRPGFFKEHPYIDVVVLRDGEIPFQRILETFPCSPAHLDDIPGLCLPSEDRAGYRRTAAAVVPGGFDHSPYVSQRSMFEELVSRGAGCAVLETNRGCPFSCSFCDWGSNTMSKVRRFDMERIRADIEWLTRSGVRMVYLVDANFGIFQRDLEIADILNDAHARYGYPKYLAYNTSKNTPERSVAISRKLHRSGLATAHILPIQHTDKDVLAATERSNISVERQFEVVKTLSANRVPVDVQLILGIPGDTPRKWSSCLTDLMEWGVHAYYWVYPYQLLPNAPASDPDFLEKWRLDAIPRYVFTTPADKRRRGPVDSKMIRNQVVVGSLTFDRSDWVRMNVYCAFVKALHGAGLTQLIALYLRFTHGVGFRDFYDSVIDNYCSTEAPANAFVERLERHFVRYLEDPEAIDFLDVDIKGYEYQVDPCRWLIIQVCRESERFYDSMKLFLARRYPAAKPLEDLVDYQRAAVILPYYDRDRGKSFPVRYDWLTYFALVREYVRPRPLEEPSILSSGRVIVSDRATSDGIRLLEHDWNVHDDLARWSRWIDQMVLQRPCYEKNLFQDQRLAKVPDLPEIARRKLPLNLPGVALTSSK